MNDDFVELDYYQTMTLLVVCGELNNDVFFHYHLQMDE